MDPSPSSFQALSSVPDGLGVCQPSFLLFLRPLPSPKCPGRLWIGLPVSLEPLSFHTWSSLPFLGEKNNPLGCSQQTDFRFVHLHFPIPLGFLLFQNGKLASSLPALCAQLLHGWEHTAAASRSSWLTLCLFSFG